MKRTIVLIRHAKSSWANPLQSDYDRPLNDRGKKDAPEMGAVLKSKNIIPDLIISSTARRAASTAKRIAAAVGFPAEKIDWQEKLYQCIPAVFEEIIDGLDDALRTVFIVAHNPGISEFANELAPGFHIDIVPTCGIVAMEMEAGRWDDYHAAKRRVFLSDAPKNHHD